MPTTIAATRGNKAIVSAPKEKASTVKETNLGITLIPGMIHILGVIHVEIGHPLASAKRIKTEEKGEPLGPERILGQTVRTDTLVPSLKTVAIFRIRERE
jgi:hypothetical protein